MTMVFRLGVVLAVWMGVTTFSLPLRAENSRLILVQIDGIPKAFFEAVIDPESGAAESLPYPDLFRTARSNVKASFDREILLPNLDFYFRREGCQIKNIYSGTLGVSTPAWGVTLTGRPSIVKANSYFNRSTSQISFYLDAFRETMNTLVDKASRTAPTWQLDLLGIPLLEDYFERENVWTAVQVFYRHVPAEQLSELGKYFLAGEGEEGSSLGMVQKHLDALAEGYDFPDQNDQAMVNVAVRRILGTDEVENQFELLSLLFPSLDHQFHVDADFRRTIEYMVKIDDWFGEIMNAVERSPIKDRTVVAIVSDHGSDFDPIKLSRSFPISRWLRREEFGGHTILSPYSEKIATSFSRPVRGIDSPRIYESDVSSYGSRNPSGEDGYVTAFTNHQGNARFDAYLRNTELNELHLVLLELKQADEESRETLFELYTEALSKIKVWLNSEITSIQQVIDSFKLLTERLPGSAFPADEDAVERLRESIEGYARVLPALRSLQSLPTSRTDWEMWISKGFEVSSIIPKGFLGPPNTLKQMRAYVVGWEDRNPGDPLRFKKLDYPEIMNGFRLTNPNAFGEHHPFNFFCTRLPVESVDLGFLSEEPLQVIWISASNNRGEVVLVETRDRNILYFPVQRLDESGDRYSLVLDTDSKGPFDFPPASIGQHLSESDWAQLTKDGPYVVLPVILTDLFRENYLPLLNPRHVSQTYPMLDTQEVDVLVNSLKYYFRQQGPDFRSWLNRGWNANPNLPTPTGSHGGFHPLETSIVFSMWGGSDTAIPRGQKIDGYYFSWDILPTLLNTIGLEEGSKPRLPGRVIPILDKP